MFLAPLLGAMNIENSTILHFQPKMGLEGHRKTFARGLGRLKTVVSCSLSHENLITKVVLSASTSSEITILTSRKGQNAPRGGVRET